MNKTHLEHAVFALIMMVPFVLLGIPHAGVAFGIAFFLGREHAQAEERYIKANGGKRVGTPKPAEFGCLNKKYWSTDSLLDFIVPALVCLVFLLGVLFFKVP